VWDTLKKGMKALAEIALLLLFAGLCLPLEEGLPEEKEYELKARPHYELEQVPKSFGSEEKREVREVLRGVLAIERGEINIGEEILLPEHASRGPRKT
jgi:hypothetical protein